MRPRSGANAAKSNTATATTAIAEVVGRFAPSPTGLLHEGSLLAAVGSYLQARHNGGRWLLRIEDVDTTRTVAGAEAQILRTLESFGLQWDGAVVRQSERTALYAAALDQLQATREVFRCQCSRRDISQSIASGLCCVSQCEQRQASIGSGNVALRWRPKHSAPVSFDDIWQGRQNIENPPDVVLRRRDGLHAYHLAVVVDDAAQGVNQVVRGADLLECTGWHILIQRSLGLGVPVYGHLPLLTEANGEKLSKSRRSVTLNAATAGPMLHQSLQRLGQRPPTVLAGAPVAEIWHWALRCWRPEALRGTRAVAARA